MKLRELINNLDYQRVDNLGDIAIKGISCNSQHISPGYLFVAIKGEKLDGHKFIGQAVKKGARAIIVEKDLPVQKNLTKILVKDTRKALACVCATFFEHPTKHLKVIGITGTNGKTTTSYLIENILYSAGFSAGLIGTINYRVGIKTYDAINTSPQADLLQSFLQEMLLAKTKYAIIEVSSHALAQRRVDYIDFAQAIFTNLTSEHLDYHGTLEEYFACKSSLFERLSSSGSAIINLDDPYGVRLVKIIKSKLLTFGLQPPADIWAKDVKLELNSTRFTAVTPQGNITVESPLLGRHNVYNMLAAIGASLIENIDFSHIASGMKTLSLVPGRLERIDCRQEFLVFVDYAHTDDALTKILQTLRQLTHKRIILVFGCGGDRDKGKRPRMGKVACELSDYTIITSDNPRSESPEAIASDIIRGIDKTKSNYKVILDRFQAIREAIYAAGPQDIVLLAGKGHESTQIFDQKTICFNDREAAEEILKCLVSKKF